MPLSDTLRTNYSSHYKDHAYDSPDLSRSSLLSRLRPIMAANSNVSILDLGSGNQSLFRQFNSAKIPTSEKTGLFSIDIADINYQKFHKKGIESKHLTADGRNLPFEDDFFSIVVSNLAISFMGKGVFAEIRRVMQLGGILIVNTDHPSIQIFRDNLNSLSAPSVHQKRQLAVWNELIGSNNIFNSEEEIEGTLRTFGFRVTNIGVGSEKSFSLDSTQTHVPKWWEIEAYAI